MCYWCYWGWPKPIRDIYDDCVEVAGYDAMHYGPAHIVWADENWDRAQWCLDHFEEYTHGYSDAELAVVRESLERLVAVPDEFKDIPDEWDDNPKDHPPPKHWECEQR